MPRCVRYLGTLRMPAKHGSGMVLGTVSVTRSAPYGAEHGANRSLQMTREIPAMPVNKAGLTVPR